MSYTLTIETAPSGKPYVSLPFQSPDLCDLQDKYGYRAYRSDYRDVITTTCGLGGMCFDPIDDTNRLALFITEAQPKINSIEKYLRDEQDEREGYRRRENARIAEESAAHEKRIRVDAENIKNMANFTGGKKIIFTVSTEYDDISDEFWIGKTGTCVSTEDVSPNALRDGTGKKHYWICDHSDPISGNMNRNILCYFGWRGTTSDMSLRAHGVRMVEKIVQFKNHARVYISRYDRNYTD